MGNQEDHTAGGAASGQMEIYTPSPPPPILSEQTLPICLHKGMCSTVRELAKWAQWMAKPRDE